MVTAPINKEAVVLNGQPFTGHTEYIAELCHATESRMLLASETPVHRSRHNACTPGSSVQGRYATRFAHNSTRQ